MVVVQVVEVVMVPEVVVVVVEVFGQKVVVVDPKVVVVIVEFLDQSRRQVRMAVQEGVVVAQEV